MAGERRGKVYEALVYLALNELVTERKLRGPIHWNTKPDSMSIEPDFTFGSNPSDPNTVLLLSYCGSAKNSDMKSWRNLGELGEAKTLLPSVPRVYCLTFGVFKEALALLQAAAFDGFRYVRLEEEPTFLSREVERYLKTKKLREAVLNGEFEADRRVISYLKKILLELLIGHNIEMDRLWKLHCSRAVPPSRSPLPSSIRRGTAKLLVIPAWEMAYELFVKRRPVEGPSVLVELGITRAFKGMQLGHDPEVIRLFQSIPSDVIKELYEKDWGTSVRRMVGILREPKKLASMAEFFVKNETRLKDPDEVFDLLLKGFRSEGRKLGLREDDGNWIFDFYLAVVKAIEQNKTAYGYAQIGKEIIENDGFGVELSAESKKILLSPWGNLSEWSTGERDLDDEIVKSLAAALVFHGRPAKNWKSIVGEAGKIYLSTYLEAKLAAHRALDPLGTIITKTLGGKKSRLATCFAERIQTNRAGRTECLRANETLIKWQSCTESGRDHKKKELCARAIGLRYHWDGRKFVPRPGVKKLILLLDGMWRDQDFYALLHSGWDEIFYPDEMDRLVNAIV